MPEIPDKVAQIEHSDLIPKNVAEFPQETEAPEARPYRISFSNYNERLCEITGLGKNKGNKALSILKEIGTKVFSRADFTKHNIKSSSVAYAGAYKPLYNRIAAGIEIREMYLQGSGRIFYFDIEPERMLYVVAITENHLETDKVRR